ncbi:MAG: sigma 54-interacting transcriptional regulator [Candidatus Entotheonellia bacterium]
MADAQLNPAGYPTDRLVGTAPAIAALRAQIRHLASFDAVGSPHVPTVLLQGETGTGKGLVARILHDSGPRASGPFIEVNCAAIPESMLEAELFGFEPGAFTDAKRAKPGLFEAASGGTLFLDEIDALLPVLQSKLLTALEAKRVRRLGAVMERAVDVKCIAATNALLPEAVVAGRFRADLYHRVAVVVLGLPPLRERGEDICALAEAFLQHFTAAHDVSPKHLSPAAKAWLHGYAWPGNVRELSHVMERVTLLHVGEEVDATTLTRLCPPLAAPEPPVGVIPRLPVPAPEGALPAEAIEIRQALVQTGGNVARAARLLGVSRDTVRYRMQRYGITRPQHESPSPPMPRRAPETSLPGPPALGEGLQGHAPAAPSDAYTLPRARRERKHPSSEARSPQRVRHEATSEPNVPIPTSAWEQKPVAVFALEVTWPEATGPESPRYDPWTERVRWEQAIGDKVQGFGGMLVQRTASILVWVFGVPQVLEQLPQRAVHSALAIRQMVVEASVPDLAPCPEVRLAVHLGAVRVDRRTADPMAQVLAVGETLALPVRLLGQVEPGEIVVSPEVGRLVEGWVALEERPLQWRTGDPMRLGGYAVIGVSPGRVPWAGRRRPTRSPFVGRERELLLLEAVLEQVKAGRGQVVSVVGAPGMGKSRLLDEFRQRLTEQRVHYAAGQCLAYGNATPYLPLLDLLRDHCEIAVDDRPETYIIKLRASLQQARLDPDANLPYLLHLLGVPVDVDSLASLSAEARRTRTFETFRQMILASSQRRPLILAVENLHWVDPTSEALLTSLVEGLAGASILVLTTSRPGYRPRWLDKSYATQIALQPLGLDDSRQIVRRVLCHTDLAPALEQQLLAKAEGNPFFLEELAYTLLEHGGQSSALTVPDTIQAVIAARIDRLPPDERHLLQAAAVIGKTVSFPLLQAMTALPEETLSRRLAHLQAAEFLSAAGGLPTPTYTFRHIFIQETAYQALLTSTRRQYHHQIAQALTEHFPALAATQPELLAHHYTAAGCTAPAIATWQRAGQRAAEHSAHVEAIAHFAQGLALLKDLPETPERSQQEIELQLALGPALMATKGAAATEVEQTYARARELCLQVGETLQLLPTLWGLWRFYQVQGALLTARELGEQLLRLAQRAAAPTPRLEAHNALGATLFSLGEYAAAWTHYEQGIALIDPAVQRALVLRYDVAPGVQCLTLAANTLWCLGSPAQAVRRSQEALALARALAHPHSLAFAQHIAAYLHHRRREVSAVHALADALLTLATAQRLPLFVGYGSCWLGWALAMQGQSEAGLAQLHQGLAAVLTMELTLARPLYLILLAEAAEHAGQVEEGLRLLSEALTALAANEQGDLLAEAYRLQGAFLLRQAVPDAAQAEACFQQALAIARRQQAKSWELRAAMSLSRLWQRQGKQVEAQRLLAPVYGWFTEGFETADLQEAGALLTELERPAGSGRGRVF